MMRINGGGLAATIVLLLLCLLWWAGYLPISPYISLYLPICSGGRATPSCWLALTLTLTPTLTRWAGYTFVQHKLVADEEASKAKHIVELLAMHKQGPGLTAFLEKLRHHRERRSSIAPQWG